MFDLHRKHENIYKIKINKNSIYLNCLMFI